MTSRLSLATMFDVKRNRERGVILKNTKRLENLAGLWKYEGDLNGIDFSAVRPAIVAAVMARFDFGGGWLDNGLIPYKLPATIVAGSLSFSAANEHAITAIVGPSSCLRYSIDDAIQEPPELIIELLKYLGFSKRNLPPISINLYNIIPRGSGLGGSGLVISCTLAAIFGYYRGIRYPLDNLRKLIEYPMAIEQNQGTGGGWNDTVPGLMPPGIKLIQTTPDNPHRYQVTRMPQDITDELAKLCILIDLKHVRKAAPFCHSIHSGFESKDPRTMQMLIDIEGYAREIWNLLLKRNFSSFGALMSKSWDEVCRVETRSTLPIVPTIDELLEGLMAGRKIGGAGGGGFMLIVCKSPTHRDRAIMRLREKFADQEDGKENIRVYAPQFPPIGLQVSYHRKTETVEYDDQITSTVIE